MTRRDRIQQLKTHLNMLHHSIAQPQSTTHNHNPPPPQNNNQHSARNALQAYSSARLEPTPNSNKQNGSKAVRRRQFDVIQKSMSSSLRKTMQNIDKVYYKPMVKQSINQKDKGWSNRNEALLTQRNNKYQSISNECRTSKVKTYDNKKTDLILNPEASKSIGIKIVNQIQRSPNLMLSAHPNSNDNFFCINNQEMMLPKRGNHSKNKSCLILSPSSKQMMPSKDSWGKEDKSLSQRKHYSRYYKDTYSSQMTYQ